VPQKKYLCKIYNGSGIIYVSFGKIENGDVVLSASDLNKAARLARIRIKDDETDSFLTKLNSVFEWIEQLARIDVSEIDLDETLYEIGPTYERPDEPCMCNTREELLSNTKHKKFDMFSVPKIVE
jgi:aspartyl-tRNA(Asn)/glutamyl-tRNA(Gln) amidotransferase subunit C